MDNDYNGKHGSVLPSRNDQNEEYLRSLVKEGNAKVKEVTDDAKKQLKQGQEKVGQMFGAVHQQVRKNPWPVISAVGLGSFLVGFLIGTPRKRS